MLRSTLKRNVSPAGADSHCSSVPDGVFTAKARSARPSGQPRARAISPIVCVGASLMVGAPCCLIDFAQAPSLGRPYREVNAAMARVQLALRPRARGRSSLTAQWALSGAFVLQPVEPAAVLPNLDHAMVISLQQHAFGQHLCGLIVPHFRQADDRLGAAV